jgi:hypothetical protein
MSLTHIQLKRQIVIPLLKVTGLFLLTLILAACTHLKREAQLANENANGAAEVRFTPTKVQLEAVGEEVSLAERHLNFLKTTFGERITQEWRERANAARETEYPAIEQEADSREQWRILHRRLRAIKAETSVYQRALNVDSSR